MKAFTRFLSVLSLTAFCVACGGGGGGGESGGGDGGGSPPPTTFDLTVTTDGSGTGTVTSSPAGIDCGVDCSENYTNNTVVTLTASPAAGAFFAGWGGACTGTGSCSVTLDAAKSVTATFDIQLFSLTVAISGSGTGTVTSSPTGIDCSISICTASFPLNTQITLTSNPDTGSLFEGYSGGCASIIATCTLTLTEDTSVNATFNLIITSRSGNQVGLNGIDDVVVHQQTLNPPTSPLDLSTFTIEAWVYPIANSDMLVVADSAYYLMIRAQTLPLRAEFAVLTSTGFPAIVSFAGNMKPLQINQWNHIVGIADNFNKNLRIGVNGELSAPQSIAADIDRRFKQTFSIGNSYPTSLGDFPFIGRIDEVRLTSDFRFSGTPSSLLDPDGATIGLWHFDEAAGDMIFADSSGKNNTLTGLDGASTVVGNRVDQATENNLFYSLEKIDLNQISGPIAITDFNNDGNNDLATSAVFGGAPDTVAILLGNGNGTFGTITNFSTLTGFTGAHPDIKTADFNNDGHQDIVVANGSNNSISVLLGSGTGSFGTATIHTLSGSAFSIASGDFDNDGNLDLAVANNSNNAISIFLGTGTGTFGTATDHAVGTGPRSVSTGLFNNDSNLDLAVPNSGSNTVSILLGTGTGSFSTATNFAVGTNPFDIESRDLNNDGELDLITSNSHSANVSVLLGTGSGTFSAATNFSVPFGGPTHLASDDLNGDGEVDIAVAAGGGNAGFAILPGTGTGSFGAPIRYSTEGGPLSIATGDLNNDISKDLIMGIIIADIDIYFGR